MWLRDRLPRPACWPPSPRFLNNPEVSRTSLMTFDIQFGGSDHLKVSFRAVRMPSSFVLVLRDG